MYCLNKFQRMLKVRHRIYWDQVLESSSSEAKYMKFTFNNFSFYLRMAKHRYRKYTSKNYGFGRYMVIEAKSMHNAERLLLIMKQAIENMNSNKFVKLPDDLVVKINNRWVLRDEYDYFASQVQKLGNGAWDYD